MKEKFVEVITPIVVCGKGVFKSVNNEKMLFGVSGLCSKSTIKSGRYGRYLEVEGDFIARNFLTDEVFCSRMAMLPLSVKENIKYCTQAFFDVEIGVRTEKQRYKFFSNTIFLFPMSEITL